jgi:hypothetical protein
MFSSRKSSIVDYECTSDENSHEGPRLRDAPPLSNARSSSNMPESDSIESSDSDSDSQESENEDDDEHKDRDEDAVIYGPPSRSLLKEITHDIFIVLCFCMCMIIFYLRAVMGIYEEQDLVLDKIMLAMAVLLTFYATLSLGIFVLKRICRNDFTTSIGFREYITLHTLSYNHIYRCTAIIIITSGAIWYTKYYTGISTINMYFPINGTSIVPEIVNITSYPINSTPYIVNNTVSNVVQSVVNTTTTAKTYTSWDTFWETFVSDN